MSKALPKVPRKWLTRRILLGAAIATALLALALIGTLFYGQDTPDESVLEARTILAQDVRRTFLGDTRLTDGDAVYTVDVSRTERANLRAAAESGMPLRALVKATGDGEFRIWHLADENGGHTYLAFADALRRERTDGWHNAGFIVAVPLMYWAWVALSMRSMRGESSNTLGRTSSKGKGQSA